MDKFFNNVAKIIEQARKYVGRTVDLTMCITYFEVGRMIVEEEQGGKARAEYGSKLMKELSIYLNKRFGKGFSASNLKNARQFYLIYAPLIHHTLPVVDNEKSQSLISVFNNDNAPSIRQSMIGESYPFKLSWTHYLILIRIKNDEERRFYEIEAVKQQWSVRLLQRQYGSSLYLSLLQQKLAEWIEEFEEAQVALEAAQENL